MRSVDGLSLSVEEGEVFGSLGPNGAGKTTMVKILVKIIKDYEGTVRSSERISRSGENGHHNKIGVSFEFPAVYSRLTALENLEFFASFYKRHLDPVEVLKMVGLESEVDKLVSGFSRGGGYVYLLYLLVALAYGLMLLAFPERYLPTRVPIFLLFEPELVGFMFVGTEIFAQKKHG